MPFNDYGDNIIFITTENEDLGLEFGANGITPTIAALRLDEADGIPYLGTLIPGTADLYGQYPAQITDVMSFSAVPERESEDLAILDGTKSDTRFYHRKSAEITITRLKTHNGFKKLYSEARFGVDGDTVLNSTIYNGRSRFGDTYGYRIYEKKDDGTYNVYFHCKLASDGYKSSFEKDSAQTEEIKFVTNYFELGLTEANVAPYPRSLFSQTPPSL